MEPAEKFGTYLGDSYLVNSSLKPVKISNIQNGQQEENEIRFCSLYVLIHLDVRQEDNSYQRHRLLSKARTQWPSGKAPDTAGPSPPPGQIKHMVPITQPI